ncbi:hypothetical protein DFH09DRAFT_1089864 [Mycena vulgaris]|nr:hypothetical protein DFH09DRAFT_1089864 [Mycena vulgaris]
MAKDLGLCGCAKFVADEGEGFQVAVKGRAESETLGNLFAELLGTENRAGHRPLGRLGSQADVTGGTDAHPIGEQRVADRWNCRYRKTNLMEGVNGRRSASTGTPDSLSGVVSSGAYKTTNPRDLLTPITGRDDLDTCSPTFDAFNASFPRLRSDTPLMDPTSVDAKSHDLAGSLEATQLFLAACQVPPAILWA